MGIIYKIENKINGKAYIGQTKNPLSKRVLSHVKGRKGRQRSLIGKAFDKYGLQSFEISVIDQADDSKILSEKECYWIRFLDTKKPNGYNLTDGGDGLINPSQEVRDRISQKLKGHKPTSGFTGHKHSEETLRKFREMAPSEETREKMSAAGKGKVISEEDKEKSRQKHLGVPRKDAHLFSERALEYTHRSGYVNPMNGKKRPDLAERNKLGLGRKDSQETLRKKSAAQKGVPKSPEHIKAIADAKARLKATKLNAATSVH